MAETKLESFKSNSCDYIMSLFLYCASKLVNQKLYLILGIFFRNLRECMNEHGYEVLERYLKDKYGDEAKGMIPERKGKVYCIDETVEFLPLIADKFILHYLPKHCPDFDQQLAVDIIYDFCNWLVKKKLTKIRVSFSNSNPATKIEDKKNV